MNYQDILTGQTEFFLANKTKNIPFRKAQLLKLKHMIKTHEEELLDALYQDLNKSKNEAYTTEISIVLTEIDVALKHLEKWKSPSYKLMPLHLAGSYCYTIKEPYGCVLILAPWNYPVQLSLAPLVGVLAAGNTAIIKCSKSSLASSTLIQKLLNDTFSTDVVYCVDPTVNPELLFKFKYDYIFFTGSERVGKIVLQHASKNCTPVTLELGGKSPTFILEDANLEIAAKRIIWSKLLNAGQTCVSPDYIYVDRKIKDDLIEHLLDQIQRQCPHGIHEESYPKLISEAHYNRIKHFILNEKIKTSSSFDDETHKIELTLFTNSSFNDPIMKDEIFGPILPLIAFDTLEEAIIQVKKRAKPLACYIFSKNRIAARRIIHEVSFGGGCVNDCVMHLSNHNLPFGGVGGSGMGRYHGKYSFDTFSHTKSIQNNTFLIDLPLRYSKSDKALTILKKLLK